MSSERPAGLAEPQRLHDRQQHRVSAILCSAVPWQMRFTGQPRTQRSEGSHRWWSRWRSSAILKEQWTEGGAEKCTATAAKQPLALLHDKCKLGTETKQIPVKQIPTQAMSRQASHAYVHKSFEGFCIVRFCITPPWSLPARRRRRRGRPLPPRASQLRSPPQTGSSRWVPHGSGGTRLHRGTL